MTKFAPLLPYPLEQVADLTRTIATNELQFALGQKPFSVWNTYVATLKAQGLHEWGAQATASRSGWD